MSIVVREFTWRGAYVMAVANVAGRKGTLAGAVSILEEAYPYVPYEDGDLRDSGTVGVYQTRDARGRFGANEAFVSYDTPYAVKLHEHPEFNFRGMGEGKWLEHAMQRRAGRFTDEDIAPPLIAAFRLP